MFFIQVSTVRVKIVLQSPVIMLRGSFPKIISIHIIFDRHEMASGNDLKYDI